MEEHNLAWRVNGITKGEWHKEKLTKEEKLTIYGKQMVNSYVDSQICENSYIFPTPSINNNNKGGISNHWRKGGDYSMKILGKIGSY